MKEDLKRTLYKLIQITLCEGRLSEIIGYDLANAIMNFEYDGIGGKNKILLDEFFDKFMDELPQVLVINPKISGEELEAFSRKWNELMSKRGAEFQVIESEPIVYDGIPVEIVSLLNDCREFISNGEVGTASIDLIDRLEKNI